MRDALALDHGLAALAVEGKPHGKDGLQRIALSATCRRHIGFAARCTGAVIEDAGDRLGRNARAVVTDDDAGVRDFDHDDRRNAGLLAGIERVVDELLLDDERPIIGVVAGLVDELFFRAELGQARSREDEAVQSGGRGHLADSLSRRAIDLADIAQFRPQSTLGGCLSSQASETGQQ